MIQKSCIESNNENKTEIQELRWQIDKLQKKLNIALNSENKKNNILDKLSIGTYKTSPDGQILYANDVVVRMLGYDSLEELKQRDLVNGEYEPKYNRNYFLEKMQEEDDVVEFNSIWKMRDGTSLFICESVQTVRDFSGNILFFEGMIRDVGDDVKIRDELSLETNLLKTHYEAVIDGVLVIDENRKVILYNQQFNDLWDLPKSLLNTKDDGLLVQQHILKMVKNSDKFLNEIEYLYAHVKDSSRDELELKDGRLFDRSSYPLKDSKGGYVGRVWSFRDITDYKKMEKELHQLTLLHEGILAGINTGICVIDKDNKILWLNRDMKKIMTQIGNSDSNSFPFNLTYKSCFKNLNKISNNYCSCVCNKKVKGITGELVFEMTCVFFDPDNIEKGIVCTITDITELERAKKKEIEQNIQIMHTDRLRTVGQLSAGLAHEINNPLSVLHASLQNIALAESSNRSIDDDTINRMLRVTKRIHTIINNLLLFSRQKSSDKTKQNINEVLNSSLNLIEAIFKKKKIICAKHLGSELPNVSVSSQKMQQVFVNIIMNAIDSMNDGGSLNITTEQNDNSIEISFKDSGEGISKENIDKILTPFFTTKKVGEGVGLGLSISYGIVKEHSGTIKVSSEVNEGTMVTVVLPI